jgi:NAD(P)-dependent dehydrogenase (short-subunit alcohol dehydrogenase family)
LRSAGQQGGALLVTVSRMDGAFGLRGGDFDPVQGGLAGLLKTAAREWPEVTCRALDIDRSWENSTDVADAVMDALARGGPIEIGLSAGERCGLRLASRPVQPASSRLESGDLVIVSGGARGVTAEAALALAKAHQPTLVLLGRSPQPESEPEWARGLACPADLRRAIMQHEFAGSKPSPSELEAAYRRLLTSREISHNVERIRETGAAVYYCEVDATNRAAVKELVRRLCDDLGPVRGIIHGAGVIEDRLIEDKDLDLFDKVVNTKVVGLQALLEAAGSDDLKCLVLFSSVTGRFGRVGQVDYAMANEVLNKIAHRQAARRPHCRVVAINWGPWDGGMVGDSLKRVFEREGVGLIPLAAGAQALVDELAERDRSAVEVAIGGTFPIEDTQRTDEPAGSVAHGLDVVLERRLDVNSHPFLKSHVIGGRPVLPVAVGMEWLAHGALHAHPGMKLVGLEDIRVLKGVVLGDDPVKVEIAAGSAQRDGGGSCVAVELRSRTQDGALCVHLRARAVLASRYGRAPQQAAGVLGEVPNCDRSAADVYRDVLFHGREFHAIKAIERMGERGAVARLSPAPPPDKWMQSSPRSAWIGDPLMVDGALQLGIVWAVEQLAAPALPSRIAAYRQYVDRMPVDAITARLLVTEHAEHRLTADVDFVDSKGAVVAQLSGCTWTVDASLAESFRRRSVRQTA